MTETAGRNRDRVRKLESQFAALTSQTEAVRKHFRIGGKPVTIVTTNRDVFTASCEALEHLECPESNTEPSLTVTIWESETPPFKLDIAEWNSAATPWKNRDRDADGDEPPLFLHFSDQEAGQLTVFDPKNRRGYVVFRDLSQIPTWERATPLRDLLNTWANAFDAHLVHGSVIGNLDSAVLLAGKGGSGKSSTALGCLKHPSLFFIGDDVCMIRRNGSQAEAYNLYHSAKLLEHDIEDHAPDGLVPIPDRKQKDGKPTFFLWPQMKEKFAIHRQLSAILLPVVTHQEETIIVPSSRGKAWHALAPTTMAIMACDRARTFTWMSRLANDLPAFELQLGSDRKRIPEVIFQFLASHGK